jgi:hypothetical protein
MTKLLAIIRILINDKRFGSDGRNLRVTAINQLLGVTRERFTPVLNTGKRDWIVEYRRPQFWYDNKPITLLSTLRLFTMWHVMLWEKIGDKGSKIGFTGSMVHGVGKKKIFKFLRLEAWRHDLIFDRADTEREETEKNNG